MDGLSFRRFADRLPLMAIGLLTALLLVGGNSPAFAAEGEKWQTNSLQSITIDEEATLPTVFLQTEKPVGYRYTVYDTFDPVRVVLDFPSMDVTGIPGLENISLGPLTDIKTSLIDLPSGKLGRVEFYLSEVANYNVSLAGTDFRISFVSSTAAEPKSQAVGDAISPTPIAAAVPVSATTASGKAVAEVGTVGQSEATPGTPAGEVMTVNLQPGQATFGMNGEIGKFKYFRLADPARLVVDVYDVHPIFRERSFRADAGFRQLRVGTYPDRSRFVFDAEGEDIPAYQVQKVGRSLLVTWDRSGFVAEAEPAAPAGGSVAVKSVDFRSESGRSILEIGLSAPAEVSPTVASGDIVRFDIKNASIGRALRRALDSSAFPSAVRQIVPYPAREGNRSDVRFAVSLKGPVPYTLENAGKTVRFVVTDGAFAEAAPPSHELREVAFAGAAIPRSAAIAPAAALPGAAVEPVAAAPAVVSVTPASTGQVFSGEKISLVFDQADIRKIFQLIGEVSDLNIIVGDDVSGNLTLRLIDVPWDQALSLILETRDLGMLKEGNVARILPKAKIRAMDEAKFTAARTKEKLEDLVTEVISVSYTSLGNVSGPSSELLTERGKITADERNKQVIVTDIPSVIAEIRRLIEILDTPERQVSIEARIVEANSTFGRDLGVKWGLSFSDDSGGPWDASAIDIGGGGGFLISPPSAGNVISGAGLGTGITFGRVGIDSTVLDLRISALETSGNGKVISTPRVTTLNGGSATISQGTKIPYTSSGADGLPKTEFVDANLELQVQPVINPDNSIILDINATNSSVGSTLSGDAPSIDTKEAETTVLVRDGETTVIGGIFVETENDSQSGVPLLQHIPVLGNLFKSKSKSSTRSEMLIFITPRIVE